MMEAEKSKLLLFTKSTRDDRITFLAVFVIAAGLLTYFYLIKAGFINLGVYGGCAFERNTGLPCPTCGWTRAITAFMGGRILKAFYTQPAAASGCIILAGIGFFSLLSAAAGVNFFFLPPVRMWRLKYLLIGSGIILAGGWAVTLARALAKM